MGDNPIIHKYSSKTKLLISENNYYIKKGMISGEKDLISISKTARREDHWTFFPEKECWAHIACEHKERYYKTGYVSMQINFDRLPLTKKIIAALGEKIIEYHIHPDIVVDHYLSCNPGNIEEYNFYKTLLIFPGEEDFLNALKNPDRKFRLATSLGITDYNLHSKDIFKKKNLLKIFKRNYPKWSPKRTLEGFLEEYVGKVKNELRECATIDFRPSRNL